ncbi:MAG: DEAD/DEAH box helicase [Leptolyngbya sp. SIO4C5]|nr:DEAD/DEAH box helicase [Leptolyngbya sp. SIO4C5]
MKTPSTQKLKPAQPPALRDYQERLLKAILEQWAHHRRGLAQLPTGGGKTLLAAAIALEFAKRGERILFLAHRKELVFQAAEKIARTTGASTGLILAGYPLEPDAQIQIASLQSLPTRLSSFESFGAVLIDEAHHTPAASYRKVLDAFPDSYVLGLTATPSRLDGTGFSDLFDFLVCGPTVAELIEQSYLSRFKLFASSNPMSTEGVRTRQGDYSAGDVARENNIVQLAGDLVSAYQQRCPASRCLVFAINVSHSKAIAAQYRAAGIAAQHLDGRTPASDREAILRRFAIGEVKVLTNCSLFDEGLDIPAIEAVQIAKPTKSLVKWLQMVGRALRPAPGKDHAIILDHTNNWRLHGLPTRPRVWTLEGVETQNREVRSLSDGQIEESELQELIITESEDQLEEISSDPMAEWRRIYEDLLFTQMIKGYNPGWIYHRLLELKPPFFIWLRYAQYRGYRSKWALFRWQEQQEGGEA